MPNLDVTESTSARWVSVGDGEISARRNSAAVAVTIREQRSDWLRAAVSVFNSRSCLGKPYVAFGVNACAFCRSEPALACQPAHECDS